MSCCRCGNVRWVRCCCRRNWFLVHSLYGRNLETRTRQFNICLNLILPRFQQTNSQLNERLFDLLHLALLILQWLRFLFIYRRTSLMRSICWIYALLSAVPRIKTTVSRWVFVEKQMGILNNLCEISCDECQRKHAFHIQNVISEFRCILQAQSKVVSSGNFPLRG